MKITVRGARNTDINRIIRVHVDTWRTAYKGVVPDEYIKGFVIKTKDDNWRKSLKKMIKENIFLVAENENGDIIGFAIGGSERSKNPKYEGELMGIYILKEYQRQGIGKTLTRKIVEELLKKKIYSMLLWVLENNPYRTFYDSLGGKVIDKKSHETLKLPVVAYGYDDLKLLIHRLKSV